jgi:hypothetical protein
VFSGFSVGLFLWGGKMPESLVCEKCGRTFSVSPYYARRGQRFCSLACAGAKRERSPLPEIKCEICGAIFKKKRYISQITAHDFCSWKCYSEHRRRIGLRGSDNPRWKGGRDPERGRWSGSPEGLGWAAAVLARAGGCCEECGAQEDLHAHHLLGFRECPQARADIENGRALCRSCHTKTHNPKGTVGRRC